MAKFDEDLGRALRECRRSKKITQKEVADYCGVSKMSVSYWESNRFVYTICDTVMHQI